MGCIEVDAQQNPEGACINTMNLLPNQFVLLNREQKKQICQAIAKDNVGKKDACGFLVVSAYQAYIKYYKGYEQLLGQWHLDKVNSNLAAISTNDTSKSANTAVTSMVATTA